ncbi:hypothetical protein NW755_014812 [Fusarium falciforme]|uniref:Chromo domain-containing protein n=1 Tax=Fusarium falciforme TaxID=195108 RepID=A0A9W8UU83_9HYPO|nr:hypothetical protein NW755_014812 [Fusarium falciforme]
MATGTPTKEGDVPTVRDKNVDSRRVPSDAGTGARSKGLRRSLRGTSNIGSPAKDNVDRLTPGAAEQNEPKSTNEQRGKKDAGVDGDAAAAPASMDESQVNKFNAHRVDTKVSTVEIQVEWEGGETTWEAERDLQEDVPALVYKYWDGLGGRKSATNLELHHVFKISKRAKVSKSPQPSDNSKDTQYMYRVQWVGYSPTDSTWECESVLREIAPDEFEKFEAKESRKRKNIHGPGRPRKKARGANN